MLDTGAASCCRDLSFQDCEGPTEIALRCGVARDHFGVQRERGRSIPTPDGRQVARLPIGKGADGAAFDAARVALVPAGRDGNVTLIRWGQAPSVTGQVSTAVSARTIALDPGTGRAYLPSATLAPAQGSERPQPMPDARLRAGRGALRDNCTDGNCRKVCETVRLEFVSNA